MKKYFGALLLLPLVLMVMAQFATAQDTMSAVLSTPYNSRPGSQVLYYFNEGLISSTSDTYKSYLTITNTSDTTAVLVHYQFYNAATCAETFDYVDILTPQDTNVINPAWLETIDGDFRGTVEGGKFLMTATAVDATLGQGIDTRAIAFNYLIGQQFITNTKTGTAFGGNAVTRMAVNALGASLDAGSCYVTPKDFATSHAGRYAIGDATYGASYPGCNISLMLPVPGFVVTGLGGTINGAHANIGSVTADTIRLLQVFRPAALIVPNFLDPRTVDAYNRGTSMQFGNRLTLVSATDVYDDNVATQFKLTAPKSTNLFAWFYDMNEKPFSLGSRTISCVTEYVISPRVVGGGYAAGVTTYAGVGTDILGGAAIAPAADEGGYIRLNLLSAQGNSWWFGWFSQSYSVPAANMYAGVGDLLVGLGRKDLATIATATTIQGVTGVLPATEGFYTSAGTLTNAFVAASTVTP